MLARQAPFLGWVERKIAKRLGERINITHAVTEAQVLRVHTTERAISPDGTRHPWTRVTGEERTRCCSHRVIAQAVGVGQTNCRAFKFPEIA